MKRITLCLSLLITIIGMMSSCQKQTDYKPQFTSQQNQITNLQNRCDSLAKALTTANNTVLNLTSDILTLTNNQNKQSLSLDSIKTQITSILTSIANLNTQVAQENTQLTNLTAQLLQTNSNVSAIDAQITTIDAQITTLNNEYTSLLGQLNTILAQLSIPTTLSNGLIAYYPFTGNANDMSGNGNNGIVYGATLTSDRFGNANSAYYFSLFAYIQTTYQGISGNNARSISFWIKNEYNNRGITPLYYGGTGGGDGDYFGPVLNRNHQHDQCGCWPTTYEGAGIDGSHVQVIYSTVTGDNNWHNYIYIVGTSATNFQTVQIFKDGTLISNNTSIIFDYDNVSGTTNINTAISANYPLILGKSAATTTDSGSQLDAAPTEYLDEIRIYNRTLTQTEITYLATH